MIKNYFKIAFRNLVRNKVSSVINIGGLSVGLATGIIILLVIVDELSFDKFNTNLNDIHLLMKNETTGGEISTGRVMPGPLAVSVRNEIPEIKYTVRVSQEEQGMFEYNGKSIYEKIIYAEPDLFNMMSFPALEGNPAAALQEPGSVVITESTAKKLFGRENPMGKMLLHDNIHSLKVAAVIRDIPENSTNRFNAVLPFRLYEQESDWMNRWDVNRILTWIQMKPHTNLAALNNKLKNLYLQKQDSKTSELFAYPMSELRLFNKFKNGKPSGGVIDIIIMLGIIGLFLLLIACINFMNLATARSEQRAREVGVRKVMGASRKLIIIQFMGEALLMAMVALGIGVLLAYTALPGFMQLTGRNFTPDFFNWKIWSLLLPLGLLTGLIAGSYPALYLSRFKPVKVLKKLVTKEKGSGLLRKGLVTFQFIISIFLIIATIVMFKQIAHVQGRPIGYNPDNLIDIPARGDMAGKFEVVKNELLKIHGVQQVSAGTDNLIWFGGAFNGLEWPGKTADQDFYITSTAVQYNWIKTAGLQLKEGRDFSTEFGSDTLSCLVNEAAARKMNLKKPVVGTKLGKNTVIGVVKDFVYNDPSQTTLPMIIFLSRGNMSHFLVRIANDEKWQSTIAQIEKIIKKTNPNFPFEFHFTKEAYQKGFEEIRAAGQMANVFGGMAIFISCLGLFGLSAFLAERRSKEISIRKVLGASVSGLWFSLSKDFLKPVFIGFVIAVPLADQAMKKLLLKMDYRIELSWWMFALAGILAVLIAIATVSFNGIKAALANPAKNLGAE